MPLAYPFLLGYFLDLILGDPPHRPHPVRLLGRLCQFWEEFFYRPNIWAGVWYWLAVMGTIGALIWAGAWILAWLPPLIAGAVATYFIYAALATRALHLESRRVDEALAEGDLAGARQSLSLVVGRQTAHLSTEEVRRAVLETIAENLGDGVVAPIFYGLLLGVPGMILYKAVNTMDSMVGYKNYRYLAFGRLPARLDDLLSYLPARLSAFLIAAVAPWVGLDGAGALRIMWRDGRKSSSPNAGWPEAALAGALGVRLGGPSLYFGQTVEKPFIGEPGRPPKEGDYRKAVLLLYGASALMAACTFLILAATQAGPLGLWGLAW